ncbi:nuclear transport factor 2 family protein [Nocardia spumae]|uniref:nuclear transport factor 2 family protein n=1 Tax=Nocardia spumae TaxID=2887190 RepID=UPI001D140563|nr:nuclear transport factor 2 family protein [Nocardia spumae]
MDTEIADSRIRDLLDRTEITDLLDRYLRSLDDGVFDEGWARAYFTADATAEMPIGSVVGRPAVLASIRRGMALFDRTVHLGTNAVIEVHGDTATARGAQLSTHVLADGSEAVFISAGHADTELVRTAEGWRISSSALRVVWTQGTPPRLPAAPTSAV